MRPQHRVALPGHLAGPQTLPLRATGQQHSSAGHVALGQGLAPSRVPRALKEHPLCLRLNASNIFGTKSLHRHCEIETGGDLGPFAAALLCLHLDTPLLEQRGKKKLYGTQNNCQQVQLGQILHPKDTKTPKIPTASFEEPEEQELGAKAGYFPTPPKGWANHLSQPTPWAHSYPHPTYRKSSPASPSQ